MKFIGSYLTTAIYSFDIGIIFADGHLQNCYFQLTACRDVVVVAAAAAAAVVVEVKALPVKNISEIFGLD